MRISDWSSDVCSSDLETGLNHAIGRPPAFGFQNLRALTFIIALGIQNVLRFLGGTLFRDSHATRLIGPVGEIAFLLRCHPLAPAKMCVLPKRLSREGGSSRSEERRGGKELVSTGRSR